MTVLVTGGAGYIGSHMVLALLDAGEQVVVIDDLSTGIRDLVPPQATFAQVDFGNADLVARLIREHGIDAIAHFAARIVVPESVADPLGYYGNNTSKARDLLAVAVDRGVDKFIFSSTAAVYGETDTGQVTEDRATVPVSPYGRSKLMVEWMLADIGRAHALRSVVLRYFNVAGADPKGRSGQSGPNSTHLIKVAVQAALGRRERLDVYGDDYPTPDGTCLRDYIQVSDLAQAHMDALGHLRNGGGSLTCNVGYARGYSVKEVIDMVKAVSGVDFEVRIQGRRPGDPAAIVASNARIRAELGWAPRYDDLALIVRQALDWERSLSPSGPA